MENRLKSVLQVKEKNVGSQERVISLLSGSVLMYNAFTKGKIIQGLAGGYLVFRGAGGYCPIFRAVGKNTTGKSQNVNVKAHITIKKPLTEVYEFWRKLDNLPLFMDHVEKVTVLNEKKSEWKVRIPGIGLIGWTSEIVEDEPNDRIGWRSLPGSAIENAGNVHFRDAGKFGTNVYAVISYRAPGGKAGEGIGKLFNPAFEKMVYQDMRNFKKYLEASEVPIT